MPVKNIMSVDLESWVHGHEFLQLTPEERKNLDGGDIVRETEFLLGELRRRSIRLTWYVVAEIADWYPELIRKIQADGHEIGYHTQEHVIVDDAAALERQLSLSRAFLREYAPVSFQAPAIRFPEGGYRLLREHGFRYDLSRYGRSGDVTWEDGICVCPVSVAYFREDRRLRPYPGGMNLALLSHGIPFGSSFWYALGYGVIDRFLGRCNRDGTFASMFIHNWQLCPPSPRARSAKLKFCRKSPGLVMYLPNVSGMFFRLMDNYAWGCARDILGAQKEGGS
jgi:hypothetical protein